MGNQKKVRSNLFKTFFFFFLLTDILYERLISVDRVDVLFGPFGLGGNVLSIAEENKIPMLNAGLTEYEKKKY